MKLVLLIVDLNTEMIADLYCSIAKGYTNAPELRVTWLEALFKLHSKENNDAEAGVCMVHVAALIREYLKKHKPELIIPSFEKICPKISEVVDEEEEGLFTESDLINALRLGVIYFTKVQ
jgi:hypothetical protein